MLQKYYCKHCCTIFREQQICPACGKMDNQPIIISVHGNMSMKKK